MPSHYLVSLSLIGVLAAAPQASAQGAIQKARERATQATGAGSAQRGDARGNDAARAGRAAPPAVRRAPAPVRQQDARRRTVIVAPRVLYNSSPYWYANSGRYLPSRRGVFGSGYLYYGPSFGGYYHDPYYFENRGAYGRVYDVGELRLRVSPRHAQVFVDGDYAGTVDDFDGIFQSLKLESGSYAIRLEAPGYETIEFDVRITPTQKVTYREDLRRE